MRSVAVPCAVAEKNLRQRGETGVGDHAAEQRVVFRRAEHGLVADMVLFQHLAAQHGGGVAHVSAVHHEGLFQGNVVQGKMGDLIPAYGGKLAAHQSHIRVRLQKGHLLFQASGQGDVVVVHDGEILALCHVEQTVARTGYAEIFFIHGIDDARIGKGLHHFFHTRIGGSVVQNEELEIRERLRQYAFHGLAQMLGTGIIYGHEHGYFRHGASPLQDTGHIKRALFFP